MKKKYNLRKLNKHRSYDSSELQEILGVHPQTVKTWKKEGLKPIKGGCSPFLYSGEELVEFLYKRTESQKVKLKEGEIYCLKCKKAVKPSDIEVVRRGIILGSGNESTILKAYCPICSSRIQKFSSIKTEGCEVEKKVGNKKENQLNLFR
jgi:hypothetical protein